MSWTGSALLAWALAQSAAAQPAPAPAPAEGAPAPAASTDHSDSWDTPAPSPAPSPAPAPAPVVQTSTEPAPPPASPPPRTIESPSGIGMLAAGPLVTAIGIPLSLLGNLAWREACGPTTSTDRCARGSMLTAFAHTGAGFAYGGGIALTGVGAGRFGTFRAEQELRSDAPLRMRTGLKVAGAVLLPSAVLGMGLARLFFWLPTPDCQTADCVRSYQITSTLTVGGLGLLAAAGAGMLMYGSRHDRRLQRDAQISFSPLLGPGHAGLGASGRF